jgi:putative hydrolase of the HAD superfamily
VEVASANAAFLAAGKLARDRRGLAPDTLHAAVREAARTLWHHENPARDYVVRVAVSSWEGLWAPYEGDDPHLAVLRDWAPHYRRESWHRALCSLGVDDSELAQTLADEFIVQRRQRHVVYPEVPATLEALQGTCKLGLITNGLSCLQRIKIAGSKLGGFFDATVIAGDIGIRKPEPGAFHAILDRLGVSPARSVMIGNSVGGDIGGAQAVGMKAVLVDRGDLHDPRPEVIPDAVIHDLRELNALIAY